MFTQQVTETTSLLDFPEAAISEVSGNNEESLTEEMEAILSSPDGEEGGTAQVLNTDNDNNGNGSPTRDEGPVAELTRRLRCLFSTITWPIVPLGTILSFALLWVLYAGFVLDLRRSCSRPLHWYAFGSLLFVAYAPHHPQIRNYIFHYSLERDGPQRPMAVRMYDQLFHTLCILYVYGGVTLLETCAEDSGKADSGVVYSNKDDTQLSDMATSPASNTCSATCPNLYQALTIYVTTLELFTFAIILPLLFLPCVYLWIIRRASVEAEAFSQFQDRLEEEEALLHNGGLTAQEIMDSLEKVKLVSRNGTDVLLLPLESTSEDVSQADACDDSVTRECCICMNEFDVHRPCDIETGELHQDPSVPSTLSNDENIIVRTKCGHVFHGSCLAGWIGGRWEPYETNAGERSDRPRRRARRTCCPLCREDLKPPRDS